MFINYYNKFSRGKFTNIETIDVKSLEPFPSMWQLTKNSQIDGAGSWYFHYQALAEESHGKLVSVTMVNQNEAQAYRLSLMYLLVMTNDVLKNTDFHLGGATHQDVVGAIQKAEKIIKKPIK